MSVLDYFVRTGVTGMSIELILDNRYFAGISRVLQGPMALHIASALS